MKSIKKLSVLMVFTLSIFFSFSLSTSYAASLGTALIQPENGWKRYDDTNSAFQYVGSKFYTLSEGFYNSSTHVTTGLNEYIAFNFYGSKLRIIAETAYNRPANAKVLIDGKEYEYSGRISSVKQALVFEVTGLDFGIHTVKITNPTEGTYLDFDAIDIDENGKLVHKYTPTNLQATPGNSEVILKWDAISEAESYTVKYGTKSGDYTNTVSATKDEYKGLIIPGLTNGVKYYFVVSSKVGEENSEFSSETFATPQEKDVPPVTEPEPSEPKPVEPSPSGERAIMVITMTSGLEKEYDLPMSDVNAFLNWYDARDAGSGPAKFAINKYSNNKGPFTKRTDYVIFDKILTFEVSEYTTN